MGDLILSSLEIRSFRGFQHLQIERLSRVNLIVGKNNIGKSALLEALRIYAQKGYPTLIWGLLDARDESDSRDSRYTRPSDEIADVERLLASLKYLFYGRKDITPDHEPIRIGPVGSLDNTLSIRIGWYVRVPDEEGRLKLRQLKPEEYATADSPTPRFTIEMGVQTQTYPLRSRVRVPFETSDLEARETTCIFINADGMNKGQVAKFWDSVTLDPVEEYVLSALRIIAPGVTGLSIIGEEETTRGRTPVVKIANLQDRLPLRSLGSGMQRILGVALALVNARDGILLIDEIENGLHYSVHYPLWRFIFQLANLLNVQVFATTHSWDCIEGFQKAAQDDPQEGLFMRLQSINSDVSAVLYDKEELDVIIREGIEGR